MNKLICMKSPLKKFCSACKGRSKVFPGGSTRTLLWCQSFYDEDGNYHHHDPNTTTTQYRCSEGHEWSESSTGSCWCGWKG